MDGEPGHLAETVANGDLRSSLEAIRDHLATELEDGASCKACGGVLSSPTAQLAKQLAAVISQIDQLPTKESSAVDDLAAARASRRRASPPKSSAKGRQRGTGSDGASGKRGSAS